MRLFNFRHKRRLPSVVNKSHLKHEARGACGLHSANVSGFSTLTARRAAREINVSRRCKAAFIYLRSHRALLIMKESPCFGAWLLSAEAAKFLAGYAAFLR